MADLATYIRDKSTGKTYKMSGAGNYQEYAGDTGGVAPVETSGIGDYYSTVAKTSTDPYYTGLAGEATTSSNADLANTSNRLKALYTDTGMGLSSFHTGAQTGLEKSTAANLASRLRDIEQARTGAYESKLGGYTATQRAGDIADAQAKAAAEAAAQEQAYNERLYALKLAQAQAEASNRGTASAAKTKAQIQQELRSDIASGIRSIMAGATTNDVSTGMEKGQAFATEALIKQLTDLYPELDASYIDKQVMSYRRPYESKFKF